MTRAISASSSWRSRRIIRRRRRAGSRARAVGRRRARTRPAPPRTASAPLASSRACTSASTSPRGDARAALGAADDADGVVDLVVLARAAGAELERGDADGDRAQPRRRTPPAARRPGARRAPRQSTPGRDRRPARGSSARRRRAPSRRRRLPPRGVAPPRRRCRGRSSASRRAHASSTSSVKSAGPSPRTVSRASMISSALPTAAPSGWSMSVSKHTTSRFACRPSSSIVSRERPRILERLHERAVADLDVEHDRVGARRDLLRHDRGRDQRQDVDGRGHVAEPVELLVGRDEIVGLADDRQPDLLHLRDELVDGEVDAEARDRLELVERAAGVAEPAAAHLPERDAAGGDDRADRDRRLVAHAAGRVLVDDLSAERGAEVERVARSRSSRR